VRHLESKLNLPNLLFFCDFPPSNLVGGSILMSRLFANYPVDKIVVLTGSHLSKLSPADGRLGCKHIVFPTTKRTGKGELVE